MFYGRLEVDFILVLLLLCILLPNLLWMLR